MISALKCDHELTSNAVLCCKCGLNISEHMEETDWREEINEISHFMRKKKLIIAALIVVIPIFAVTAVSLIV